MQFLDVDSDNTNVDTFFNNIKLKNTQKNVMESNNDTPSTSKFNLVGKFYGILYIYLIFFIIIDLFMLFIKLWFSTSVL